MPKLALLILEPISLSTDSSLMLPKYYIYHLGTSTVILRSRFLVFNTRWTSISVLFRLVAKPRAFQCSLVTFGVENLFRLNIDHCLWVPGALSHQQQGFLEWLYRSTIKGSFLNVTFLMGHEGGSKDGCCVFGTLRVLILKWFTILSERKSSNPSWNEILYGVMNTNYFPLIEHYSVKHTP